MNVKRCLFELFDELPPCTISAWPLYEIMHQRTGRKTMPATLLQYAREYADISGAEFVCINTAESVYRFRPGHKIAGALDFAKE